MRPMTRVVFSLSLTAWLVGCTTELPTDGTPPRGIRPQFALVGGAVTPINGGVVSSPVVTIDNGPGDQADPRVSGDLACYTDNTLVGVVRYFRFSSGGSNPIPSNPGEFDQLCAIDGNLIAYRRQIGADRNIAVFDASTSASTDLDPVTGINRNFSTIGGNTVAFVDYFVTYSDLRVVDLATPGQSLLLAASGAFEANPNLSPAGDVVVWRRCGAQDTNCSVLKAMRSGGTWGAPQTVASSLGGVGGADTDGSYIVYDADLPSATGHDIYIQALAGGPVTQLAIPGYQEGPRISSGVIAFRSTLTAGFDVFVYVLATNTLYQISSSGSTGGSTGGFDATVLSSGDVRVVWAAFTAISTDEDIFATTFAPAAAPFSFGGFRAPVQGPPTVNLAKAGGAIPVKFSLGGDRGLNIFASGSPSSVTMTCNAGTPTGTVDATATAGNSGLSYDATSDTYSYIWKTDKAWASTCRRLTLRFVDGTVAEADFQFK